MKQAEFNAVIRAIPVYTAQFRVIKLTPWHESLGYEKGDMLLLSLNRDVLVSQKGINTGNIPCKPTFVEFVGYVRLDEQMLRLGIYRVKV